MSEDIAFPRAKKNSKKDGRNTYVAHLHARMMASKIYEAIKRAHIDARAAMERMGMLDLLKKSIEWDSIESGHVAKDCIDGEDDDSDSDDEIAPENDSSVSSHLFHL